MHIRIYIYSYKNTLHFRNNDSYKTCIIWFLFFKMFEISKYYTSAVCDKMKILGLKKISRCIIKLTSSSLHFIIAASTQKVKLQEFINLKCAGSRHAYARQYKVLYLLIIHEMHKWKVNAIREKNNYNFFLFVWVRFKLIKPIDKLCWENNWQVVVINISYITLLI